MSGNENSGKPPAPSYGTSDGTVFIPKEHYPIWSWDTVQEFKVLANDKGYAPTDEQIARIATLSNFVSVQGAHAAEEFGSEKRGPIKGLRREVSRLKATNPDIKVCGYYNSAWAWWFTRPPLIPTEQEKRDLFLYDEEEGKYFRRGQSRYADYGFDILKPSMRKWWVEAVAYQVNSTGADGFFWDQQHGLV